MVGIFLLQPSGIFCNLLIQSIYNFDFKGVAVDLHPPGLMLFRLGKLGSANGTKEFKMFLNSDSISVVKQLSVVFCSLSLEIHVFCFLIYNCSSPRECSKFFHEWMIDYSRFSDFPLSLQNASLSIHCCCEYGYSVILQSSVTTSLQLDDYHCELLVSARFMVLLAVGCLAVFLLILKFKVFLFQARELGSGNGTKEFRVFLNSDSTSVVKQWSGLCCSSLLFLLIDMPVMGLLAMFPCCFTPNIDGSYYYLAVG
ncbi:hypothetical protein R6Q57_025172 [Mikania cordata]